MTVWHISLTPLRLLPVERNAFYSSIKHSCLGGLSPLELLFWPHTYWFLVVGNDRSLKRVRGLYGSPFCGVSTSSNQSICHLKLVVGHLDLENVILKSCIQLHFMCACGNSKTREVFPIHSITRTVYTPAHSGFSSLKFTAKSWDTWGKTTNISFRSHDQHPMLTQSRKYTLTNPHTQLHN